MPLYGLIGFPLSHSFSKGYFTEKFIKEQLLNYRYENFPLEEINLLPSIIEQNPDLLGFNVTIPYKEKVFDFVHEVDPEAQKIGAINTIKIFRTSKTFHLKGYNTDIYGFTESIKPLLHQQHKSALILGTGGASKAIKAAFEQLQIKYQVVSRSKIVKSLLYTDLTKSIIEEHTIIVNCTPSGTFPNIDEYPPIPYKYLNSNHLLYDLVYNPSVTAFLKKGSLQNAQTINGLSMLHLQAEKAWEIWNSNNL